MVDAVGDSPPNLIFPPNQVSGCWIISPGSFPVRHIEVIALQILRFLPRHIALIVQQTTDL